MAYFVLSGSIVATGAPNPEFPSYNETHSAAVVDVLPKELVVSASQDGGRTWLPVYGTDLNQLSNLNVPIHTDATHLKLTLLKENVETEGAVSAESESVGIPDPLSLPRTFAVKTFEVVGRPKPSLSEFSVQLSCDVVS
jgi:hypothetical protein